MVESLTDVVSAGQALHSAACQRLLSSNSCPIVGIQGGRGSFNEDAALKHLPGLGVAKFAFRYLHTTANVLKTLDNGLIDAGQFAIHNSLGGDVEESVQALAHHTVEILARYVIKIAHVLMIAPRAELAEIDTVVTHPQVFRQCQATLRSKYAHLKLKPCSGDLIDPARVAELMGQDVLPRNVATISNKVLSDLHGLKVVDVNLQDADDNYTTFLLVQRPH